MQWSLSGCGENGGENGGGIGSTCGHCQFRCYALNEDGRMKERKTGNERELTPR